MISEALILAGGLGTRLRDITRDKPKAMVEIKGRPFLSYLLDYLIANGIRHVVLSTGHLTEMIESFYGGRYKSIRISYSVEDKALGTGGAVYNAIDSINSKNFMVLNGDTLFRISLPLLEKLHFENKADYSIALRLVDDCSRFGMVETDKQQRITVFGEKSKEGPGLINGGIYIIRKEAFLRKQRTEVFSIEKDVFSKETGESRIFGLKSEAYFIDIGTPEDYERAISEIN